MIALWMVAWIIYGTPAVGLIGTWNAWGLTLAASIAIDVLITIAWVVSGRGYLHAFGRTYRVRR